MQKRFQLLARAEAKIYQCVVVDKNYTKRAIAVYQCGTDVFWGDTPFQLFDQQGHRIAPKWLREQLANPPEGCDVLDHLGRRIVHGELEDIPSVAFNKPSMTAEELGGEEDILQG